jgi:hypothetical protein
MRLTVEEHVLILESYLKTVSYAHCSQCFFEKFERQAPVKSAIVKIIKKFRETGSLSDKKHNRQQVTRNMAKRVDKCAEINRHHFQHLL